MSDSIPRISRRTVVDDAVGEKILWHGRPSLTGMLWQVMAGRWLALYLIVLLFFRVGDAFSAGASAAAVVGAVASVGLLTVVLGGLVGLLAWLNVRATTYTITDRRISIELGVALPMTVDLPLSLIDSADLRRHRDGSGDIVLTLAPEQRPSYMVLWPHVRPFRWLRVQPSLRALADVDAAATALAEALGSRHAALQAVERDLGGDAAGVAAG
ncbi:MAG: photosynthetic complex putative assembly protein PuhB [Pseudomonadota bacterium]